ncbi:hypothetical protein [Quatrionicoccus australiensis]|uniref:hypothetical protein n=1 Tax=Quatrionicoccus australiensis TaxID=138118 RepID=UPI001CF81940|nr:hypothetical protein [Quatrionicoccus australiensis]UCV15379.1 hypothetical protein KI612_01305 [Quatrionicoccus australiensis]
MTRAEQCTCCRIVQRFAIRRTIAAEHEEAVIARRHPHDTRQDVSKQGAARLLDFLLLADNLDAGWMRQQPGKCRLGLDPEAGRETPLAAILQKQDGTGNEQRSDDGSDVYAPIIARSQLA